MSFYVAPFTFDFATSRVRVNSGVANISVIDLYEAAKLARESEEGIVYDHIAEGSGRVDLGGGVQVGLTVALVGGWQVKFPDGDYIASVRGGNLVGGPGGDPIAYSAGVQILLVQSAASTIVNTAGGGTTAEEVAEAVLAAEVHTGFSFARMVRTIAAAVAGKTTGGPGGFVARNLPDTADQITGAADADGNRTSASYGP